MSARAPYRQSPHASRNDRNSSSRYGHSSQSPLNIPVYIGPNGGLFLFGLEIDNEIRLALEIRKTWRSTLFFVEQFTQKKSAEQDALLAAKQTSPTTGDGSSQNAVSHGLSSVQVDKSQGNDVQSPDTPSSSQEITPEALRQAEQEEYIRVMTPHSFGEVDFFNPDQEEYFHHFRALIKSETSSSAKKMRALVREATALASSLPLYLESSVFFRIDESRMDVMKCIITGPEDTPYAHGCFLFDIYCSNEFPAVPPQVNLQTTGSGSVRFNPNLYNCGKVCLSLLGTWRGGPNEQWNEATTTLLQVFVSIQSLILVSQPFFNEPGYETLMNTTKGDLQSAAYNNTIRLAAINFAMLDMLKNPPLGFEQVIKLHFTLKAPRVMKDVISWLEEAVTSHATQDHFAKLKAGILDLKNMLLQLNPDAMDGLIDPETIHPPSTAVVDPSKKPSEEPSSSAAPEAPASSVTAPIGDDGYTHPSDIYPHLAQNKSQ